MRTAPSPESPPFAGLIALEVDENPLAINAGNLLTPRIVAVGGRVRRWAFVGLFGQVQQRRGFSISGRLSCRGPREITQKLKSLGIPGRTHTCHTIRVCATPQTHTERLAPNNMKGWYVRQASLVSSLLAVFCLHVSGFLLGADLGSGARSSSVRAASGRFDHHHRSSSTTITRSSRESPTYCGTALSQTKVKKRGREE